MNTTVLTGEDVRYLAQQPESEVSIICGQMTTLMQNITDLQNDTEDKVAQLESQGWFKRMTNTLFGKNKATKQEIQKNNDKVVTYVSQSVAQLYEMNMINERVMCSLGNRMNEVYMQVTDMNAEMLRMKGQISQIMEIQQQTIQAMGAFVSKLNEKIESVDNFHMLISEIQNGMYHDSSRLYNLCTILSQLDKRQMDDGRKMTLLRDTMRKSGVITDDELTVWSCLQDIVALPQEKIGIIYLELCNFRNSFPANLFADMIENYHFLSKMEKMSKKKDVLIQKVLDKYELDPDAAFSINDIAESFFENKQACLVTVNQAKIGTNNGAVPSSSGYENLGEAEQLYLDCKYDDAYPQLLRLANEGNGKAIYCMIRYSDSGYGSHKADDSEKANWCRKAKESGHPLAMFTYADSSGCSDSEKTKILKQYEPQVEQLAGAGDPIAQLEIGVLYNGVLAHSGFPKDLRKCISWLRKAAEAGFGQAMTWLYEIYRYEDTDVSADEALKWLKAAAEKGDAWAQYDLGLCYEKGDGVSQDYREAVKWYRKATEQGFEWAQYSLGLCYANGNGVRQDYTEAVKWYRKAAEQGDAKAQFSLGWYYTSGTGVSQNYDEAVKWYRKAAEQGHANAQLCLGLCYLRGEGVKENLYEAVKWIRKAAEQGDDWGQYQLGNCYASGNGVGQDYGKAAKWYRKAADQGNEAAKLELAYIYRDGKGVKSNPMKAVQLLTEVAEAGDAEAQNALGLMYDEGKGVRQDSHKAVKWFTKAVEQNYYPAFYNLGICFYDGDGITENEARAYDLIREAADQGLEEAQEFLNEHF